MTNHSYGLLSRGRAPCRIKEKWFRHDRVALRFQLIDVLCNYPRAGRISPKILPGHFVVFHIFENEMKKRQKKSLPKWIRLLHICAKNQQRSSAIHTPKIGSISTLLFLFFSSRKKNLFIIIYFAYMLRAGIQCVCVCMVYHVACTLCPFTGPQE